MKKLSLDQFSEIYSKIRRACVEIAIVQENGILLSLRNIEPAKDKWHLPGGTVFYGESIMDALHRIAKEEINVDIEIIRFLGYVDWEKNKNSFGHSVSLVFLAKILKGEVKTDFQAKEAKFFKKLPENIIAENKKFIEEHLAGI